MTKRKPELVIETGQGENEGGSFLQKGLFRNEVQIKPVMSAKNRHEMKGAFNFVKHNQPILKTIQRQQPKLRML